MYSLTLSTNWMRARRTNCTDNGFPSKLPIHAEPVPSLGNNAAQATSASIYNVSSGNALVGTPGESYNGCLIRPYGAGANTNTMSMRVIGWAYLREDVETVGIWIPTLLVEMQATLSSTVVGVSGLLVANTDLFASTLTLTYGNANVSNEIISPGVANALEAHAVVDLKGFNRVEFTFTTGGSATNCNALVKMM